MSDTSQGTGGLTYDKSKRQWPNELNVLAALILIIVIFEILGAIFMGQSLLFDTRDRFDSIFKEARLRIIIIQVAVIGIIAIGMTQVIIFLGLAVLFHIIMNYTVYGKHTYVIGSNEAAARMSGINVPRHLLLVYVIAGMLAGLAAVTLTSKNLTAQSGMGLSYELEAIAMAVIGGVHALKDADFVLKKGEHVAIMGDNGAGKSTFARQITGVEQRTRGTVIFDGEEVNFAGPLDAREAEIETVFQTLALADDLNVPDNLFLGREKTKFNFLGPFRFLDYRGMREDTMPGLVKTGVKIPNIKNTIGNMSGGQRQCVAIARTATFASKLTIMDEPTAALGVQETAPVENIIRTLKEQGESLILVSHNMRQVFDLVDRIVVFRRGRMVANLNKNETDGQDVVAYITGAKTGAEFEGAA